MIIKETARSTYLDVSKIAWEPTKYPGVETKVLYQEPSGKLTTLTRMARRPFQVTPPNTGKEIQAGCGSY